MEVLRFLYYLCLLVQPKSSSVIAVSLCMKVWAHMRCFFVSCVIVLGNRCIVSSLSEILPQVWMGS